MRRALAWLLGLLLVVCVAGVVLDEVARRSAEHRVAGQLASHLGVAPTVEVHGWPFLAQVRADRIGAVEVTAPVASLELAGHRVGVHQLQATAEELSPLRDVSRARAGRLRAGGLVDYADLSTALGASVTSGGDDRITLARTVSYLGRQVAVELTGTPSVSDGKLLLLDPSATAQGMTLGPIASRAVADMAAEQAALPTLAGLQVTALHASPAGVQVEVSGSQVDLAKLR